MEDGIGFCAILCGGRGVFVPLVDVYGIEKIVM
jgi:hypothetical protein